MNFSFLESITFFWKCYTYKAIKQFIRSYKHHFTTQWSRRVEVLHLSTFMVPLVISGIVALVRKAQIKFFGISCIMEK